jgi:hypothetical protein
VIATTPPKRLNEQPGPGASGLWDLDGAQLEIRVLRRLLLDRGACGVGQPRPLADLHRGGLVHDQQSDVGLHLAGFLHQPGSGQP